MADRTCRLDGCERKVSAKGLCSSHYNRLMRHGDPLAGGPFRVGFPEVVLTRLVHTGPGDCCEYRHAQNNRGYGMVYVDGVLRLAHVAMYEHFVGSVPEGHEVHHRCENHACVNPAHLVALTPEQHRQQHWSGSCHRGHPLTPENLYLRPGDRGRGVCRQCRAINQRQWQDRHKQAG